MVGAVLVGRIMGEDFWQTLLLRSRFGVPFEDDGIHGYGWGLVFGYSLILTGALTSAVGALGVRCHVLRKDLTSTVDRNRDLPEKH